MASSPHASDQLQSSPQWRLPFCILAIGGVITAFAVLWVAEIREQQKETHFFHVAELARQQIGERMKACANLTQDAAGIIVSDWEASRNGFSAFASRRKLSERYTGFQFMGYAMRISPGEETLLTNWAQANVSPHFRVRSEGAPGERYAVLFVEPKNGDGQYSLGLDPWSLHARHPSLKAARDSGEAAICAHRELRDLNDLSQTGFIFYAPVYEQGSSPTNTEQRRAHIRGFTYTLLNAQEFFHAVAQRLVAGQYGFEIYDAPEIPARSALYSSALPDGVSKKRELVQSFPIAGRNWTIRFLAGPEAGEALSIFVVWSVGITGAALTLLVAAGSHRLLSKKVHADMRAARATAAEERARAAIRTKDDFLAMLSHELRTPLTPVLAAISGLQSDPRLPVALKGQLTIARRNTEQEIRLINDLLDLTRATHGKLHLDLRWLDLHSLIVECAEDIPEFNQRGLHLEIYWMAEQCGVLGDRPRLVQLFSNLLRNAAKFTPPAGLIRVHAHNEPGAKEDTWLVVSVDDTGVGIDPAMLERIFEPFEQGGSAITRRYGGLGLGLSICRSITELHGGAITASSAGYGRGARFTVRLPCAATPMELESKVSPASPAIVSSHHLLLVEDHADTAAVLSSLLQRLGHRVTHAASVSEALTTASLLQGRNRDEREGSNALTLVLSDLGLPDGSGLDLMRELSTRFGLRGIALSGFGGVEDERASAAAGFLHHLVKPVNFEQLRDLLGGLESRHNQTTQV